MGLNYFIYNTLYNRMTPEAEFKQQIEQYLSGLPSKWKDKLVEILCLIKAEKQTPDCQKVKECETLTTLSDFEVEGSLVSIQYKNEAGVTVTRSFDAAQIVNETLNHIDPNCLTTEEIWVSMTLNERIQLLIDSHCNCCGETVLIEYDSTDIDICSAITNPIVFTLTGQAGQGVFSFVITQNTTSSISIPSGLTGLFKATLVAESADYTCISLENSSNVVLDSGCTDGSGAYGTAGNPSTSFNITSLDHIVFTCTNSG